MKTTFLALLALLSVAPSCGKKDGAPAPGAVASGAAAAPAPGLPASTGALAGFEGEIGLSVKSKDPSKPTPPMTLLVKADRIRLEVPRGFDHDPSLGQAPRIILNVREKKAVTLVDERRMAVVLDFDKMADQARALSGSPAARPTPSAPPKVTRTGKVDTVAGYRCEDWDIASADGERVQVCVGNEAAPWLALPDKALPPEQAWARELFDGRHFPLRLVSYSARGAEESRIEVTKLEKKALADGLFEVPAGYQVVDMGNLAKMMGGAMPTGLPPGLELPSGAGARMPPGKIPPEAEAAMRRFQEQMKAAKDRAPK